MKGSAADLGICVCPSASAYLPRGPLAGGVSDRAAAPWWRASRGRRPVPRPAAARPTARTLPPRPPLSTLLWRGGAALGRDRAHQGQLHFTVFGGGGGQHLEVWAGTATRGDSPSLARGSLCAPRVSAPSAPLWSWVSLKILPNFTAATLHGLSGLRARVESSLASRPPSQEAPSSVPAPHQRLPTGQPTRNKSSGVLWRPRPPAPARVDTRPRRERRCLRVRPSGQCPCTAQRRKTSPVRSRVRALMRETHRKHPRLHECPACAGHQRTNEPTPELANTAKRRSKSRGP